MDGGGSFTESHFWHKQEQRKGLQSFPALSGTPDWTEWGFKKSGLFNAWSAAEANAVADPHVFATNTVFNPTPASINNATATRLETDQHLALGIPALSPATGRADLSQVDIPSHNMNTYVSSNWPEGNRSAELQDKWLHSDLKDVAYLFTHGLFNTIVTIGGLRE